MSVVAINQVLISLLSKVQLEYLGIKQEASHTGRLVVHAANLAYVPFSPSSVSIKYINSNTTANRPPFCNQTQTWTLPQLHSALSGREHYPKVSNSGFFGPD